MSDIAIFAPSPTLTVTIEEHPAGGEVHVHAGGQGAWQARMLVRLGIDVRVCGVFTGESGSVVRHLLEDEGVAVTAVTREGRASAYVHDRRSGNRRAVIEVAGEPLGRHDLDELYSLTLRDGLEAGFVLLSGPAGDSVLPDDTYRRLAGDLRSAGVVVVADLSGGRLESALEGGVALLKVNRDELALAVEIDQNDASGQLRAMAMLRERGAETVVLSRGDESVLLVDDEGSLEVVPPHLEATDPRGAGDSLTAGIAGAMIRGERPRDALTLGVAAGALNATRHGLGSGHPETIDQLRHRVGTRTIGDRANPAEEPVDAHTSPDALAHDVARTKDDR